MGTAVFANGFEYDTDDQAIRNHFSTVGAIKDLYFQSKGSAVITYVKKEAASRALSELDGSTLKGQSRYVAVKLDEKVSEGKGSGKGKGKDPTGTTVFASGFDYETDESAVKKHFGAVGAITSLYFQSKGGCVITYKTADAANRAVAELHETTMKGQSRYVAVKMDEKGPSKGSSKGSGKASGGGKGTGAGIYVSGFDFSTDENSLWDHFKVVGEIKDLYFQSSGSAVVYFVKPSAATRAVAELHETTMKGQKRYVSVRLDNPDRAKGKSKGKW